MDITQYFHQDGNAIYFEESQASQFAKFVAGDFNPIHDPGSKRFCVPGDLLFSVLLHHYGAAELTRVQFAGMLDGNTRILLPDAAAESLDILDPRERSLLNLTQSGDRFLNSAFVNQLCEEYVRFSGQTFPGVLVPLMQSAGVMINPDRPLVIYKDMAIELNAEARALFEADEFGNLQEWKTPLTEPLSLQLADNEISVEGRKGLVRLCFSIEVGGVQIGIGEKNMVLSGLREYDDSAMQAVIDQYNERRNELGE